MSTTETTATAATAEVKPVTVVTRKAKGNDGKNGKPVVKPFEYQKIITPATKRGGKEEAQKSTFPKFADIVEFLKGKVEYVVNDKGEWNGESCIVSYIVDGWNLESNRNAAFSAANTPEAALDKMRENMKAMAVKLGISYEDVRKQLLG